MIKFAPMNWLLTLKNLHNFIVLIFTMLVCFIIISKPYLNNTNTNSNSNELLSLIDSNYENNKEVKDENTKNEVSESENDFMLTNFRVSDYLLSESNMLNIAQILQFNHTLIDVIIPPPQNFEI